MNMKPSQNVQNSKQNIGSVKPAPWLQSNQQHRVSRQPPHAPQGVEVFLLNLLTSRARLVMNETLRQSVSQSVGQSVGPSVRRSVGRSVSQPVSVVAPQMCSKTHQSSCPTCGSSSFPLTNEVYCSAIQLIYIYIINGATACANRLS